MASGIARRLIGTAEETPPPFSAASAHRVNEAYGAEFMDDITSRALQPYLKINFLDGDKEEMRIHLVWEKDVYSQGSSSHPGLVQHPSFDQLRQIGGPIGGLSGGQFAMEVINCARYEGDERSGFLHDRPEELRRTAEETPDLYYRPLKFEYVNEGEAPDSMYEALGRMASKTARRLTGEADETSSQPSAAQSWFDSLGDTVQSILAGGDIRNLEIEAVALMVSDDKASEESTEHAATWEEAQDANVDGRWTTVHDENTPITGFAVYARRKKDRVWQELAAHVKDFQTHEEAETYAEALAALLSGVAVNDYSIATGKAYESCV